MGSTKRIRAELAKQVEDKKDSIRVAESLGKGNISEVRAWKFQAEQWQEVLDNSSDDGGNN